MEFNHEILKDSHLQPDVLKGAIGEKKNSLNWIVICGAVEKTEMRQFRGAKQRRTLQMKGWKSSSRVEVM